MHNPAQMVTRLGDVAIDKVPWGTLQWFANAKLMPGAQQTLGFCHLLPGKGNPLHYHPDCEEILHVVHGFGKHSLDDQWVALQAGSTIRIPAGVKHKLVNESSETMIVWMCFSSGDRQTVFLEDF